MAAVHADDLFHLYRARHGDVAALRGLSLEVADGEVVSVLGPSGSGKTTLLSLCAGFSRPSSGSLAVLGRPLEQLSERRAAALRRASIGIVRQHYHRALPRELTAEEIVGFPLRLLGRLGPEGRRRVAELLRDAGLAKRARARPAELSGGEQQRVAVCAALVKRPLLVLADEPTGELDAASTTAVVELLLGLARDAGAAALVVTHDAAVAGAVDRTIHIRDGRLAAEGMARPVLIVDEQGWLRLPGGLREQAGVRERVRARATWGKVELHADDPLARPPRPAPRLEPAEKREVELALAGVGLGSLCDRRADRLSGGEQRRVAVARALAPGPRVLLADEPTAHLDRVSGRMLIRLLQEAVREAGATIVAASHDPDLAAAADDRLTLGSAPRRRVPLGRERGQRNERGPRL